MKHRALSMLLALVMVVSLLPIAAIAGNEEANFTMRLQGGDYYASYILFADTYEGVRFKVYDESEDQSIFSFHCTQSIPTAPRSPVLQW